MNIHPSAIITPGAKLAEDSVVGPYSIVGGKVSIGARTVIGAHCVLEGNTVIGSDCQVFSGSVIGSRPQDLKFKGEEVFLEIGNNNIIREYCTINPGTVHSKKTVIGDNNLLMAYSHVAHDCRVGSGCVLANNSTLAGTLPSKTRWSSGDGGDTPVCQGRDAFDNRRMFQGCPGYPAFLHM
jgi:UDP-N-acetylglucosamine acyltransferase